MLAATHVLDKENGDGGVDRGAEQKSMSQLSSLLTILMDRKTLSREELLSLLYKKIRGTHSGRLAARVENLRKRGYEIESPRIKYKNGKKILVKRQGFKQEQRTFWYKLLGSKTKWKKLSHSTK